MGPTEHAETLAAISRERRAVDLSRADGARLERALQVRMKDQGIDDLDTYVEHVEASGEDEILLLIEETAGEKAEQLIRSELWEQLRDDVLPAVLEERGSDVQIRVWDVDCSDGLSTYLMAALFREVLGDQDYLDRVQVWGTETALEDIETAGVGRYLKHRLPQVVTDAFELDGDELVFSPTLRRAVAFGAADPLADHPITNLTLLDLRDGIVLYPPDGRRMMFDRLTAGVEPGGIVLVSPMETLVDEVEGIEVVDRDLGIYQTVGGHGHARAMIGSRTSSVHGVVKTLLVTEHELYVKGLARLLEDVFGEVIEVVGMIDDYEQAHDAVLRTGPGLIIADAAGDAGRQFVGRVKEDYPSIPILALVDDVNARWRELVSVGVSGVLPRSVAVGELVGPVLAVADGLVVLPEPARLELVKDSRLGVSFLEDFDDDEVQLWSWIAEGRQDSQIAEELYVSTRTVKRRVGSLLRKLGVRRRVEAAELAGRLELLDRDD